MTLTDSSHASVTGRTPDAATRWSAWRADREAGLATPHVRASSAHRLRASDTRNGRQAEAEPLHGERTVVVPEGGSTIAALVSIDPLGGGTDAEKTVAAEVALRTGRYIVRVRDPRAAARVSFSGVPTYACDESWVLDAPVRWYDTPQHETVGGAQPGLVHETTVIGEVDLTVDDTTQTLRIVGAAAGTGALLFSDASQDTAEWRILSIDPEIQADAPEGTLRLDLNRTVNLPYAFSDYGTCPRPVVGNALTVPVAAGEKAPR
jgi:uncharacterized protein